MGVRIDPLREIAANKICALVSRSEIKDVVDMKALLDSGVELERALVDARTKDASVDPATVAWVLEQVSIQPSAAIPGGIDAIELDQFRKQLVQRLRKAAFDLVK